MTKSSELIDVNGLTIQLIRSRRKSLSLEVGRDGIKARAPLRMSKKMIMEFVNSKQNWLEAKFNERPAPIEKLQLNNGALLFLENTHLTLTILENQRGSISLRDDRLYLPVAYYAPLMDVERSTKQEIKVREYKRRWGSCDHLGSLSFNWRIIMAPTDVLDYVVIHELAHCHEFNHSKRFWNLVAQQMPDWKDKQDWLHINGGALYQF